MLLYIQVSLLGVGTKEPNLGGGNKEPKEEPNLRRWGLKNLRRWGLTILGRGD